MVLHQQDWGNLADYDLHLPIPEDPGLPVLWQVYLGLDPDCPPLAVYQNPTQTQVVELQVLQDQGKTRITKYQLRHTVWKDKNFLPLWFLRQINVSKLSNTANLTVMVIFDYHQNWFHGKSVWQKKILNFHSAVRYLCYRNCVLAKPRLPRKLPILWQKFPPPNITNWVFIFSLAFRRSSFNFILQWIIFKQKKKDIWKHKRLFLSWKKFLFIVT